MFDWIVKLDIERKDSLCPIELTLSQSRNEWIHLLVIRDIPVKILLTKIPRFRN